MQPVACVHLRPRDRGLLDILWARCVLGAHLVLGPQGVLGVLGSWLVGRLGTVVGLQSRAAQRHEV